MPSIRKKSLFSFIIASSAAFGRSVFAQTYNFAESSGLKQTANASGYNTASSTTPEAFAMRIISIVLSLVGIAFLGFLIYGGISWMTAQGNEKRSTQAKHTITDAIVGIIIVIASYAIAYFVVQAFSGPTLQ